MTFIDDIRRIDCTNTEQDVVISHILTYNLDDEAAWIELVGHCPKTLGEAIDLLLEIYKTQPPTDPGYVIDGGNPYTE